MFLFSAIAFGAAAVVRIEISVAARFRQSVEALYAAEAGLNLAVAQLRGMPTWTPVVNGGRQSALVTGGFRGSKAVPGGGLVELCCGPGSASNRLAAETRLSPLVARRGLEWQPFLWIPFAAAAPENPPSRFFLVAWIANDEEEAAAPEDANETVIVRSEALEPGGIRRSVEALVTRRHLEPPPDDRGRGDRAAGRTTVEILRWREVR